jgi:hypothetical protein
MFFNIALYNLSQQKQALYIVKIKIRKTINIRMGWSTVGVGAIWMGWIVTGVGSFVASNLLFLPYLKIHNKRNNNQQNI